MNYVNNPQIRKTHEKFNAGMGKSSSEQSQGEKKGHPHSVSIHHAGQGEPKAENPHHVHVHHSDGSHEHSDHANFGEAMDHAQSQGSEPGQALGAESGAPVDGAEMEDGY